MRTPDDILTEEALFALGEACQIPRGLKGTHGRAVFDALGTHRPSDRPEASAASSPSPVGSSASYDALSKCSGSARHSMARIALKTASTAPAISLVLGAALRIPEMFNAGTRCIPRLLENIGIVGTLLGSFAKAFSDVVFIQRP